MATKVYGLDQLVSAGGGSASFKPSGLIHKDTTLYANAGLGPADIKTYSLPAGTLDSVGSGIKVRAWGTTGSTAEAKTVLLTFGGTTICRGTSPSVDLTSDDWYAEAVIIKSGSNTQQAIGTFFSGSTADSNLNAAWAGESIENTSLTITDTAAIAVSINVTTAASANEVFLQGFTVEYLG